jgi:hypothetical protein
LDDPQSQNPYSYVRNNPANFVDPTGEQSQIPPNAGVSVLYVNIDFGFSFGLLSYYSAAGMNPFRSFNAFVPYELSSESRGDQVSQGVPIGIGAASSTRIPVGGGLGLELSPRGFVPPGGSTSSAFIQDLSGKTHLRLDQGFNVKTNQSDIHFNQRGTFARFGIANHTLAGPGSRLLHHSANTLRVVGRPLLPIGIGLEAVSIATAENRPRAAVRGVSGLAGAFAGAKAGGAGGALLFSPSGPGAIAGGLGGAILGGVGGYYGGSIAGESLFDFFGGD